MTIHPDGEQVRQLFPVQQTSEMQAPIGEGNNGQVAFNLPLTDHLAANGPGVRVAVYVSRMVVMAAGSTMNARELDFWR